MFPSDIEYVVLQDKRLTGEYRVVVCREEHLDCYDVEVEKPESVDMYTDLLAKEVREAIKVRVGVAPRRVIVLREGEIHRATHKAKRVIEKREQVWAD